MKRIPFGIEKKYEKNRYNLFSEKEYYVLSNKKEFQVQKQIYDYLKIGNNCNKLSEYYKKIQEKDMKRLKKNRNEK